MTTFTYTSIASTALPYADTAEEIQARCRTVFARAEAWLNQAGDRQLISYERHRMYLAELAQIAPGDWHHADADPQTTSRWELATRQLRARVIYNWWVRGLYCSWGRDEFLLATGLPSLTRAERAQPTQLDLIKGQMGDTPRTPAMETRRRTEREDL